jgi:hypothetical protein
MVDFIDDDIDRPVVIGPNYQIGWLGKWDRITIPGAITPATLQPIYKESALQNRYNPDEYRSSRAIGDGQNSRFGVQ